MFYTLLSLCHFTTFNIMVSRICQCQRVASHVCKAPYTGLKYSFQVLILKSFSELCCTWISSGQHSHSPLVDMTNLRLKCVNTVMIIILGIMTLHFHSIIADSGVKLHHLVRVVQATTGEMFVPLAWLSYFHWQGFLNPMKDSDGNLSLMLGSTQVGSTSQSALSRHPHNFCDKNQK